MSLNSEITRLKDELLNKDKIINSLSVDLNTKEEIYNTRLNEMQKKLEDKDMSIDALIEKFDKVEKEMMDLRAKEVYSKQNFDIKSQKCIEISKKEFLDKKFSWAKYDEKYIIKCLQRDILDFQEYTKEQIKKVKTVQEELINLIQESVNECMPEYEVRLYGSHATNLCLQWSDLDVVLIHKRNYNVSSYNALQGLYLNLLVFICLNFRRKTGRSQ
jgi:DNA polymerase sigma